MKTTAKRRVRITIKGVVQGVGFRPFIYTLANRYGLKGFCLNDQGGVTIEVEGEWIERFIDDIRKNAPPLARIDSLDVEELPYVSYMDFTIRESHGGGILSPFIPPDTATCEDCLRELRDPSDRRYRYPFINCTNCGPRYSIIRAIPYDRPNTTMSEFRMCPACEREYNDPTDRRFHAQPNACADCGPAVMLTGTADGWDLTGERAIERTRELLREGAIVAIKGLGGFHLACDATNSEAVERLRERKRGSGKPFAVMAPDARTVEVFAVVGDAERRLLEGRVRPIVILDKRSPNPLCSEVSPCTATFGVILPYTPLHHLILEGFTAPVMTSGNVSEEPIVVSNHEATERLKGMADCFLVHDREIHMRVDDSIVRVTGDGERDVKVMVRRGRGYTPGVVDIGEEMDEILACGAELKGSFVLTKGRYAVLSQHIGDLTGHDALEFFRETLHNLKNTFRITPNALAHDLHPDYLSTGFAEEYAKEAGIMDNRVVGVQHHHAHIVSVMAEHGLDDLLIGVAFDGTGYGADGCVWGGEFMVARRRDFCRRAHIGYVPMPGGDKAVKEPWRMAVSHLFNAYGRDFADRVPFFAERFGHDRISIIQRMMLERVNSPLTSSVGRLFDAISSLVGICDTATFEAEAAIRLEKAALDALAAPEASGVYPFDINEPAMMQVDTTPLVRAVVDDILKGVSPGVVAAKFHNTMALVIVEISRRLREESGLDRVVLSGGVFQNTLLLKKTLDWLKREGFRVWHNETVPINDGGVALGQAVVAWERLKILKVIEI